MTFTIETFKGEGEHPFRFRLLAGNGEVVCQSEGYLRSSDRDHTARELAKAIGISVTYK